MSTEMIEKTIDNAGEISAQLWKFKEIEGPAVITAIEWEINNIFTILEGSFVRASKVLDRERQPLRDEEENPVFSLEVDELVNGVREVTKIMEYKSE